MLQLRHSMDCSGLVMISLLKLITFVTETKSICFTGRKRANSTLLQAVQRRLHLQRPDAKISSRKTAAVASHKSIAC